MVVELPCLILLQSAFVLGRVVMLISEPGVLDGRLDLLELRAGKGV